jgi:4-hydroxybenzoyl-CoA reductase subunit beta
MLTLPRYEYLRPASLDEALARLAESPDDTLVVAGGTDAVPNLKHRLHEPRRVLALGALDELRFAREEGGDLELGPLVTLAALAAHPVVTRELPGLAQAASRVASPQIRNMGTLGGNLCLDTRCTYYNQTPFWRGALGYCLKKSGTVCHVVPAGRRCVAAHSSDVAPMLIALGASVELASATGRRELALADFFVGDGVRNTVRRPDELVTRVTVPAAARGLRQAYHKLRPRQAIDFPMLSVAFAARLEGAVCAEARLVVSALAAKPKLVSGLDAKLAGRPLDEVAVAVIAEAARAQCHPLPNVPYDTEWRKEMVPVVVARTVRDALSLEPS